MSKIHLRMAPNLPFVACHTNTSRNVIAGYSAKSFKEADPADRCKHCESIYLTKRNASRRKKGLPPVVHMDD